MQNQAIPTLLPVYQRADVAFERGEGAWLYDRDGATLARHGPGSR